MAKVGVSKQCVKGFRFPAVMMFSVCLPVLSTFAHAEQPSFNPLETFARFTYPDPVNSYRGGNGRPGPGFWQNHVDYAIKATLTPDTRQLSGSEVITYTNNSPDTLDVLWLQIEQNRYRRDARGAFGAGEFPSEFTEGMHIRSVRLVSADGHTEDVPWVVSDTRLQLNPHTPIKGHGASVKLQIAWDYTVPGEFGGRTDVNASKNGDIFEIAQWYPRMAVYDDVRGWDTQPFLNNEFYLEYGDIDYTVTLPWNMLVVGSGTLVNPQDVLTATQRKRLEQAAHSDTTVMIRSAEEVNDPASRPRQTGELSWHFHMKNTRDVAFGASKAYVWDAARINLPAGKTALAMSAYPAESGGHEAWGRATEYVKSAVEYFSKTWYAYPYPVAVNEAGTAGGMEYPGLSFDSKQLGGADLQGIIAHEIGHTGFPMIVGSNERRDAWMDEGFNTFLDVYESDSFNHGEFAPKRDPEYAPDKKVSPADQITQVTKDENAPPLLMEADAVREKYRHPVTYFKAAFGLVLLREQIIGPQRFDPAFRKYIEVWAYKHPTPSDFFRFMDSETGEDLGWFWRGWFATNWKTDLAVQDVSAVQGDWKKGAVVTVANLQKLPLPATLRVLYVDGSVQDLAVPVETWIQHSTYALTVAGDKQVKSATLDPDHRLPDVDRSNDTFTVK